MPYRRIIKHKLKVTIDVSANATTATSDSFPMNGILKGIAIVAPDLDGTNTYTVTLKDADDSITVFERASLTENTTTAIFLDSNNRPLELPLHGNMTVTITSSGTETADREFTIIIYYLS